MASIVNITISGDLQDYCLSKIAEGTNKMSVINALRNKIINRVFAVFACVRKGIKYERSLLLQNRETSVSDPFEVFTTDSTEV